MCKCVNVEMGSYERQTSMRNPFNEKWVCIDTCMVQEIAELWHEGIETIECCCGHNVNMGYIAVKPTFTNEHKMKRLGYQPQPHDSLRCIYYPKS